MAKFRSSEKVTPQSSSNAKNTISIRKQQWTDDVMQRYHPVKELGRGRFGTVVLARKQKQPPTNEESDPIDENDTLVAIKVVGHKSASKASQGYAHREIEILTESQHPNIVRFLEYWEPDTTSGVVIMALSYAQGPTLEYLLRCGGKLSLIFSRVVSAQLIDAVAYLHSRACVHRDIKPDNLVITGADDSQDDIWDDIPPAASDDDLVSYRKRWHVTLIDFGLARALSPDVFQKSPPENVYMPSDLSRSQGSSRDVSLSKSRRFDRKMSAVGNKIYSAPEIVNCVKKLSRHNVLLKSNHDVTKTLSEYVSFYGLMADAYSIGNTMKHMLTGVYPNESIEDVIAFENNPVNRLIQLLFRNCCNSPKKGDDDDDETNSSSNHTYNKQKQHQRNIRYRRLSQIPNEALRLIKGLTESDPRKRTTITQARLYPWVDDVLDGYEIIDQKKIDYMTFVMKQTTTTET